MEREEFKTLVKAMKAVYTKADFLPDADSFNVWYEMLKDLDYQVTHIAIQKHMLSSEFPPTIASIRKLATGVAMVETKPWADGWEEVLKAIRKFGRYREAEALDSMSEITRKTVKRLGFTEICNSENIMADRANFRMIYEQYEERAKEDSLMPQYLRDIILKVQIEAKGQAQIGTRDERIIEKW